MLNMQSLHPSRPDAINPTAPVSASVRRAPITSLSLESEPIWPPLISLDVTHGPKAEAGLPPTPGKPACGKSFESSPGRSVIVTAPPQQSSAQERVRRQRFRLSPFSRHPAVCNVLPNPLLIEKLFRGREEKRARQNFQRRRRLPRRGGEIWLCPHSAINFWNPLRSIRSGSLLACAVCCQAADQRRDES